MARTLTIFVWAIICVFTISATANLAGELKVGTAVVEITPRVPYRMSGYFNERLSQGIKDALQAKAIVLKQGDQTIALVFCDLVGISLDVATRAREQASAATGIPADHIAVMATHSHTGPLYFDALRDFLHERAVTHAGEDKFETIDYPAELVKNIAAAITEANSAAQPAQMESGTANEDRVSFNRRFYMRDGSVRFNPGELNPDIIRAAGPIDPQIGLVFFKRSDAAEPFAAIASFALHCDTVGGMLYSADFPKVIEDRLKESFGSSFTLLFGAGTCGNINHIDVTTKDRRKTDEIGSILAEAIHKAVETKQTTSSAAPALAVRSATVDAPLQSYSESEMVEARKNMELVGTRELPFLDQVRAYKILDLQRIGKTSPLEVQAFRLDKDTAIVTLPGEVFVEFGLMIKASSPFMNTLVMELTNNDIAYIPTKKAFDEGSYEIVNSRVTPGSGEKMANEAIRLLQELE